MEAVNINAKIPMVATSVNATKGFSQMVMERLAQVYLSLTFVASFFCTSYNK